MPSDRTQASTTYQGLSGDVRPGNRILIDDGRVLLEVTGVDGPLVRTRVLVGGTISDNKGINLPVSAGVDPCADAEDFLLDCDLISGMSLGVDIVAAVVRLRLPPRR